MLYIMQYPNTFTSCRFNSTSIFEDNLNTISTTNNINAIYHIILKELYPTVYEDVKIQKLIMDYKKAIE